MEWGRFIVWLDWMAGTTTFMYSLFRNNLYNVSCKTFLYIFPIYFSSFTFRRRKKIEKEIQNFFYRFRHSSEQVNEIVSFKMKILSAIDFPYYCYVTNENIDTVDGFPIVSHRFFSSCNCICTFLALPCCHHYPRRIESNRNIRVYHFYFIVCFRC